MIIKRARITRLMEEKKVSIYVLAENLQISIPTYYRKMNGVSEFTESEIYALAKTFGIEVGELL